jgi:hypothetical protein
MIYITEGVQRNAPHLKGSLPHSNVGAVSTKNFGFVADITNEFILGLDILHAYDASVDIGCQTLCLAEEEVSLWSPGAGPRPSSLVVARDQIIPGTVRGNNYSSIGESPRGRKRSSRTKPAVPAA